MAPQIMQSAYAVEKKTSTFFVPIAKETWGSMRKHRAPFNWGHPGSSDYISTAVTGSHVGHANRREVTQVSEFFIAAKFFSLLDFNTL